MTNKITLTSQDSTRMNVSRSSSPWLSPPRRALSTADEAYSTQEQAQHEENWGGVRKCIPLISQGYAPVAPCIDHQNTPAMKMLFIKR